MNILGEIASEKFHIFTDGGRKERWGSWAYVIVQDGKILREGSARIAKADANEMEFQAAIEAVHCLPPRADLSIHSDSRILIDCLSQKLEIPKLLEIRYAILRDLLSVHRAEFHWVKAHAGHPWNERCDELCRLAYNGVTRSLDLRGG